MVLSLSKRKTWPPLPGRSCTNHGRPCSPGANNNKSNKSRGHKSSNKIKATIKSKKRLKKCRYIFPFFTIRKSPLLQQRKGLPQAHKRKIKTQSFKLFKGLTNAEVRLDIMT